MNTPEILVTKVGEQYVLKIIQGPAASPTGSSRIASCFEEMVDTLMNEFNWKEAQLREGRALPPNVRP